MNNRKSKHKAPAVPPGGLLPIDSLLRIDINRFVATYRHSLPDEQYQYQLSRLLSKVERTESGNAIRFVARYGDRFRYVPERGDWYAWNGQIWVRDLTGESLQAAKQTAAYLSIEADLLEPPMTPGGEPLMYSPDVPQVAAAFEAYEEKKDALLKWGYISRSARSLDSLLKLARSEPGVTVSKASFDADDHLLNCRNGILDLKTRTLFPHKSDYLMTLQCNVVYDPAARCPLWIQFLEKVSLNRLGIMRFLRQLAGMGLAGDRIEDIFVVFYGSGSNGKTVFQETLREILGTYAGVAPASMFMERRGDSGDFEVAELAGVRLLFKDETQRDKSLDEEMVKSLTGGSGISAAFKFKDRFTFLPKFLAILSTNHRPRITGNDNGIWRRVKEVPWSYNFDHDPQKKSKPEVFASFRQEGAGILNWMIDGYADCLSRGVQIPEDITHATNDYRKLSDILGAFLEEECYLGADFIVTKKELYTVYRDYMEENGSHPLNKPNFGDQLKERGYQEGKTGKLGHYWKGLRLRDKAADEPLQFGDSEEEQTTIKEVII